MNPSRSTSGPTSPARGATSASATSRGGIAALGDERPEVEIEYHSFELSPDTPVDFEGSRGRLPRAAQGHLPAEQVQQMLERVTGIAADAGLDYDFDALQHTNTREGARAAALREGAGPAARARRAPVPRVLHRGPPRRPRSTSSSSSPPRSASTRDAAREALESGRYLPAVRPTAPRRGRTASTACRSSSSTASTASRARSPPRSSRRSLAQVAGERDGARRVTERRSRRRMPRRPRPFAMITGDRSAMVCEGDVCYSLRRGSAVRPVVARGARASTDFSQLLGVGDVGHGRVERLDQSSASTKRLRPCSPAPIDTRRPAMVASTTTGHAVVEPSGVMVPRS